MDRQAPSLRKALAWTAVTLAASAVLQAAFYRNGGATALSDIPGRLRLWDLSFEHLPFVDARIEYPVVVGYIAFVVSVITTSVTWAFVVNCALNGVLALTMTALLRVRGGRQIWRWVLGTPLFFFAFHNWDLWAMVPAVIGIYAFERHRDRTAGVALALGASTKLFPGLFLPPLVAIRWFSGDRRGALRLGLWAAATTLVLNGPIALVSPSGWLFPARFQGRRSASWGTLWFWAESIPGVRSLISGDPAAIADKLSIAVLVVALFVVTAVAIHRELDAVSVAAAVTVVFLLSNKIYSPTYDLWIVPFFVLLPISRKLWVTYCVADIGVFVLVFGRFHGLWGNDTVVDGLWVFVLLRATVLVFVLLAALHIDLRASLSSRFHRRRTHMPAPPHLKLPTPSGRYGTM